MIQKATAFVRGQLRKLLELRDAPAAIAGGVACGIYVGFTPLFGAKTLLSLGAAWVARCSKLASVIAVSLTDLLTPFWPVIWRIQYEIGYWILSDPHRFPPALDVHALKVGELLRWTTFVDVGLPMLVGSAVLGVPVAAAAFAATFFALRGRVNRTLGPAA